MDKHDFEWLIHPVSPAVFERSHWEREPLVIERDQPDYYSALFSLRDIDSIVAFHQLRHAQLKIASTDRATDASRVHYVESEQTSDINRLYGSYSEGETLAFNFAQNYWPSAARLSNRIQTWFSFPAGINIYFTPPGAQGFLPHFDTHEVFVLQVEGSKRWRIYGSWEALPSGLHESRPVPREQLGRPTREFRLNAGDLLYLPRGFVHEAETSEQASIHWTIGVRPYKWSDLVGELLELECRDKLELRKALPIGFLDRPDGTGQILARLAALVEALAGSGHGENALARLGERLIERTRPLPDSHFLSLDRLADLDLETRLCKRDGMPCRVRRAEGGVEILYPGNRILGPAELEPAFRFLARVDAEFSARDLPDGLSDSSKLVLARRAIKEGLLRIADAHPAAASGT